MADRVLTDKVRSLVLDMGMDLVGFGPVERWKNAPFLMSPSAILPQAKTVIVSAIHITDTWAEMGGEPEPQERSPGGWMDQNSLMDRVAYRLTRYLNDMGHKAIAVASSNIWRYRKFEGIPSLFAPDLSHIHAATAAGLAEIGWSGLAITPEFGSRCRYISVVTDAELVPTPMYSGPALCDRCMECVRKCPTDALRKELKSPPHRVEIGGKVFEYANKNIWRCAWAEHFDLDLNSNSLKDLPQIGEKEILQEISEKGKRGHERGVCQKVCVPPHLRSDKPSFGREDKLISQNRINHKYPDNMPTLRKLRDDLVSFAIKNGADMAAVGPLDIESSAGQLAAKDAPGMRTVIALAMQLPNEALNVSKYGPDSSDAYSFGFYQMMHHLLLKLARQVEDCGYHASSYTGHDSIGFAQMAGLSKAGADFAVPEFGKNVITGAVVTDAPLDPTPEAGELMPQKPGISKPSAKKLRANMESFAEENLVSLFGVSSAERYDGVVSDLKKQLDESILGEDIVDTNLDYHGPYVPKIIRNKVTIRHPKDYIPDAKSVIVMGMHFPQAIIENAGLSETKQIGTYAFWQYQTAFELRFAACKMAVKLSKLGYKSVISENLLGIGSQVDSHRGKLPDSRCGAVEAMLSGLGTIGKNGSLITPEFGPNQRFISIVTDAELSADELNIDDCICNDCSECIAQCPMNAITDDSVSIKVDGSDIILPLIDRHRCDWSKKYALCPEEGPSLIGNVTDVAKPDGKVTIETIAEGIKNRDQIMKRRPCILENCLKKCRYNSR